MLIGCKQCGSLVGEGNEETFTATAPLRIISIMFDLKNEISRVDFLCKRCYTNLDLDEYNQQKKDKLLDLQFQELIKNL